MSSIFNKQTALIVYSWAGAGLIAYGVWQFSQPASFIFLGAYVLVDAWRMP